MLPSKGADLPKKLKVVEQPAKTFSVDFEKKRMIGVCEDLDAVRQAVFCILNTERYDYLIYSWNYGVELQDLFGRPAPYVKSEIKRRIKEALTQDDRIRSVDDFSFTDSDAGMAVAFTVHSTVGTFDVSKEVVI